MAQIVQAPYAPRLVHAYFDPLRGFAGAMFDGLDAEGLLANNPSDRFVAADLAAVSLLDVRFGPASVRKLLGSAQLNEALEAVPVDVALWDADELDLDAATTLWNRLRGGGIGRTRASKLFARKRPHLIPIVDSVIATALHFEYDTWQPLAEILRNERLRQDVDALRSETVDARISTLRLLDVATWMTYSRSKSAVQVQLQVGAPPSRDLPR